jgi:uncharacterized protein with von Willebrand factor type A (vWA) domain
MLVSFFMQLREAGVPVSQSELLVLLEALKAQVCRPSAQDFYHLARLCLVKDERYYDRFDRVFAQLFEGAEERFAEVMQRIPEDWVKSLAQRTFTEEELRALAPQGGWEELLARLRDTLKAQQERHEGGSRWVGTAGTSPFGTAGASPSGVRIGTAGSGQRRAFKVWNAREFRGLDESAELGTRNMKVALRRLRRLAREGAAEQLDLDDTIRATARNGGLLDLKLVPERRNHLRVLLLLDIGGSMDDHVALCQELFAAARSELRHLVCLYFHNFIYENLWRDSRRREAARISTAELLRTYGREYRVILVGDATMSPYEIMQAGGSVEHWNPESGATWMGRLVRAFPHLVWLNPQAAEHWEHISSLNTTRELLGGRMFPLTIQGIADAIRELQRPAMAPPDPGPGAGAPAGDARV